MSMIKQGSKAGWMKALALAGIAVTIAGCSSDWTEITDDNYVPQAHYERHPIIVTKRAAYVKDCGAWPEDFSRTTQNEPYTNFGCAEQNNIAAMVANPNDLVRPRALASADAMRRSKVFDQYRHGEHTAAEQEKAQQVIISDVTGKSGQ